MLALRCHTYAHMSTAKSLQGASCTAACSTPTEPHTLARRIIPDTGAAFRATSFVALRSIGLGAAPPVASVTGVTRN